MSEDEVRKVADDIFEAFNRQDEEGYLALCAEDAIYEDKANPSLPPYVGKEDFKRSLKGWWTAFPDVQVKITHRHIGGDTANYETIAEGTHTGDMEGIPATGKRISLPIMEVIEIRGGLVRKIRAYYNAVTMMEQLGVPPKEYIKV